MKNILRNLIFFFLVIFLNSCGGFDIGDALDLVQNYAKEFDKNREFTADEIQATRKKISEMEEDDERRKANKNLHRHIPYQNQRTNKEKGDISCNVTALSGVLSYFGNSVSPDKLSNDVNRICRGKDKEICNREVAAIRGKVADQYGLIRNEYDCKKNKNLASIANRIDEFLSEGKAVMISS
jgi:hypothetical protein